MGHVKYHLDEPGRRLLLARYDGRTETITRLQEYFRVPRWVITRWAGQLGLARQKEPPWTPEEEAYLTTQWHRQPVREIARHLGRTQTAVKLKAKRLGVRKAGEGYTMNALGEALGCDHKVIERWIQAGWLKGSRRRTERLDIQGGDMWYFSDQQVRQFIRAHPNEIDPRRADWLWLVDLLTGGIEWKE